MASLAFAFSLRGTRARPERDPERASEPGRLGPCRRLRVASIAGPSGLPSVTVLVRVCALGGVWPERDPKPVGAATAKLRSYLWALKSKIRAWCFFRIMDLSFSCG